MRTRLDIIQRYNTYQSTKPNKEYSDLKKEVKIWYYDNSLGSSNEICSCVNYIHSRCQRRTRANNAAQEANSQDTKADATPEKIFLVLYLLLCDALSAISGLC